MVQEKPRSSSLHHMLVARDDRHSYLQRLESPIGPGAYTIPSTFHNPSPNLWLRVVHRDSYGREFSRQNRSKTANSVMESSPDVSHQLCLAMKANMHQSRRDQLRRMILAACWSKDENAALPSSTERDRHAARNAKALSPKPVSISNCASQHTTSSSPTTSSQKQRVPADVTDILEEYHDSVEVVEERSRALQQPSIISVPLSYQDLLMRTSYLDRLQKQQRRKRVANQ
ncbi:hypothetical protein Plhal304r1_c037g0112121 [Plasmopara halstedii]